jgi:predicted molibdopterin-dependent oxidoreductase YjgC
MGALPGVLPGYKSLLDKETRKFFRSKWKKALPKNVGKTLNEIFADAKDGKIDFLYIMGENPVISDPDSDAVVEGLKKIGFIVVQDLFLTETAKYADVVFPVSSFAEKDGTFTNTERRIQRVRKVIDKISPDVYEDWYILTLIANNLKAKWKYNSWLDIFNEIKKTVGIYSHIEPEKFDKRSYFWPHSEDGYSEKRLYQNSFSRPNGKAKFIYQEPNEIYTTNDKFPYLLIIGRLYEQYHTSTMTGKTNGINKLQPYPKLYINPKDAINLKIKNDDWVVVESETGKIKLRCELSLDLRRNQLFTSFHYSEAIANKLTSKKKLDPHSKMAPIKVVAVRIKREQ